MLFGLASLAALAAADVPVPKCADWADKLTAAPTGYGCKNCCAWQPLDHFSDIANTKGIGTYKWQQRFTVEDPVGVAWGQNDPIFVVVCGQGAMEKSAPQLTLPRALAKKEGARLVVLEHRFYGGSQPRSDITPAAMAYLSSDAAIADAKNFVSRYVRGAETGHPYDEFVPPAQQMNATGKIVLFGGGYGGALAAWTRQQYPGVVDGAVAVSATMKQTFDFTSFFTVFDRDDAFRSPAVAAPCRKALKAALTTLLAMSKDTTTCYYSSENKRFCQGEDTGPGKGKWCGGQPLLDAMFNASKPGVKNPDKNNYGYYFLYKVAQTIGRAALFQNPSPVTGDSKAWQLDQTCKLLEGADCDTTSLVTAVGTGATDGKYPAPSCIQNLVDVFKYNGNYESGIPGCSETASCSPSNQANSIWAVDTNWVDKLNNPALGSDWYDQRSWWWQKCTEMGFFQGTGSSADVFEGWPQGIDPLVCSSAECAVAGEGYCSRIFAATDGKFTRSNIKAWVAGSSARYSGKDGFGGSNVYFANGKSDPWSIVGVTVNDADANVVTGIYSAGHMAPLAAAAPDDPADLTAVRSAIGDFVASALRPVVPSHSQPWYAGNAGLWSTIGLIAVVALGVAAVVGVAVLLRGRQRGAGAFDRSQKVKQHIRNTSGHLASPLLGGQGGDSVLEPTSLDIAVEDPAASTPVVLLEDADTTDTEVVAAGVTA